MFGLIMRFVGGKEGDESCADMVGALEQSVAKNDNGDMVDRAARLRNNLRRNCSGISHDDKIRIVKALNKAKVRALMGGTDESFSAFTCLNSISSDVVQLL